MSSIAIKGAATGTGTFTLESPATNTDRVLVLPDEAGTVLTSASSLASANLTGALPAIDGSALTGIAGGVTSLNGQTGGITNTSLYAIGGYVTGRTANSTNYTVNSTLSGASLYATGSPVTWKYDSTWHVGTSPYAGNSAPPVLVGTGTWRCVSPTTGETNSYPHHGAGLWVRIS
jgi:hypothetical protein